MITSPPREWSASGEEVATSPSSVISRHVQARRHAVRPSDSTAQRQYGSVAVQPNGSTTQRQYGLVAVWSSGSTAWSQYSPVAAWPDDSVAWSQYGSVTLRLTGSMTRRQNRPTAVRSGASTVRWQFSSLAVTVWCSDSIAQRQYRARWQNGSLRERPTDSATRWYVPTVAAR